MWTMSNTRTWPTHFTRRPHGIFFLKACFPQEIACISRCSFMNWNIMHHWLNCILLNRIQFEGGRPNVGVFLVTSTIIAKLNHFFDDPSHHIGVTMLHVDAILWHLMEFGRMTQQLHLFCSSCLSCVSVDISFEPLSCIHNMWWQPCRSYQFHLMYYAICASSYFFLHLYLILRNVYQK